MLSDASARRARTALDESDALLRRLERQVEALWECGHADAAVAWSTAAGHYAALNHPGRFTSPRLERVLGEIGRQALPPTDAQPGACGRVLHVMTEAYETGGHTRLVRRWIENDAGRAHDVVLTNPASSVPAWLRAAAEASGGELAVLTHASSRAQAAQLRARAAGAAVVVLHIHMFDPVPLLAFADRPEGPPVVFEDHADHMFWLGTSVADIVVSLRSAARELAVARRGVSPDRSALLPIPVPPVERALTREQAKHALGIDATTTVLLTVAVPFKFAGVVQPSWFDATIPLLRAHRDWVLLAAGPSAAGEWVQAGQKAEGRIVPLGSVPDLTNLLHAADVYVDSYPFSSNTSLIEAAGHGIPVVGFSPEPAAQAVLLSHDPGIEALIPRPVTPEGFRAEVEGLVADPGAARALGERMRAGIEAAHSGPGWQGRLEEVYERAATAGPPPLSPPLRHPPPPAEWELVLRLLLESVGQSAPLQSVLVHHGATMPLPEAELNRAMSAPPPGWDAIAVPEPTEAATLRALEALEAQARAFDLTRLALALPPTHVDALVPVIEGWLDGRELELELLAVDDLAPVLTFGRVVVLPNGHPLRALAARNGALVA